ncbi:hypothetical protein B0J18DRAFT_420117 [Chaetomium sp. MPI-SDFR-AT-0129]|nr:hypothetical protein B0J18DRAFT_420117 [Chaetomium sp. MPI-SDFR-AT-0129]
MAVYYCSTSPVPPAASERARAHHRTKRHRCPWPKTSNPGKTAVRLPRPPPAHRQLGFDRHVWVRPRIGTIVLETCFITFFWFLFFFWFWSGFVISAQRGRKAWVCSFLGWYPVSFLNQCGWTDGFARRNTTGPVQMVGAAGTFSGSVRSAAGRTAHPTEVLSRDDPTVRQSQFDGHAASESDLQRPNGRPPC